MRDVKTTSTNESLSI